MLPRSRRARRSRRPLAAGEPTEVEHPPSFVSGIGAPFVFGDVWPLARELLDGSVVSSLEDTARAVRLVAERARVVAEGGWGVVGSGGAFGQSGAPAR